MKTSSKKIAIGALAVGLVTAMGIGGTLAFMTDSEQVTNHFSVGDLDITIEEPEWDDTTDGKDLIPGDTRDKDPTITAVKSDSYMRVMVMIQDIDGTVITDQERLDLILTTIRYAETDVFKEGEHYSLAEISAYPTVNPAFSLDTENSSAGTYCYNYNDIFLEGTDILLFSDIVVPTEWDVPELEILGEYQIVLQAQAILADTFADAESAFAALDGQISKTSDIPVVQNYGTVGKDSDLEFALAGRVVSS